MQSQIVINQAAAVEHGFTLQTAALLSYFLALNPGRDQYQWIDGVAWFETDAEKMLEGVPLIGYQAKTLSALIKILADAGMIDRHRVGLNTLYRATAAARVGVG